MDRETGLLCEAAMRVIQRHGGKQQPVEKKKPQILNKKKKEWQELR